jgi:TRAP-type mannitol/chloroaromatic compound transport system substrate-binding protein
MSPPPASGAVYGGFQPQDVVTLSSAAYLDGPMLSAEPATEHLRTLEQKTVLRRSLITAVGVGLAGAGAGAVALPAAAQGLRKIEWRCASSFPKELDTIYFVAGFVADRVAKATGNRFRIHVTPPDPSVQAFGVLDAVSDGTVQCGHTASLYFVDRDPAFSFDSGLPFGLNARQHNAWMIGGGLDLLRNFMRSYDVVPFPAGNTGAQLGGWFNKEINDLSDLRGLKFRISGLGGSVLERLGVEVENLPGDAVYGAMKSGAVDGAKWIGPYDDEKLKLNTVAKYCYYPGWWQSASQLSLIVNRSQWERLPEPYQVVFTMACAEANAWLLGKYDVVNVPALRRMVAAGTVIKPFPQEVMTACYRTADALNDEIASQHPTFARLYADWRRFRGDIYEWFRLSELALNDFVLAATKEAQKS